MTTLERLGLLKMDFLGLRTLTVIRDAVNMIKKKDPNFSIDKINYKDKNVFDYIELSLHSIPYAKLLVQKL